MANSFQGEVAVTVDGVEYTLRMDIGALAEFEHDTGHNAFDWAEQFEKGATTKASELVAMVRACLKRHHPDADAHLASDILSSRINVLTQLLAAAAPDVAPASRPGKGKPRAVRARG